jgi:hypothetical protein
MLRAGGSGISPGPVGSGRQAGRQFGPCIHSCLLQAFFAAPEPTTTITRFCAGGRAASSPRPLDRARCAPQHHTQASHSPYLPPKGAMTLFVGRQGPVWGGERGTADLARFLGLPGWGPRRVAPGGPGPLERINVASGPTPPPAPPIGDSRPASGAVLCRWPGAGGSAGRRSCCETTRRARLTHACLLAIQYCAAGVQRCAYVQHGAAAGRGARTSRQKVSG